MVLKSLRGREFSRPLFLFRDVPRPSGQRRKRQGARGACVAHIARHSYPTPRSRVAPLRVLYIHCPDFLPAAARASWAGLARARGWVRLCRIAQRRSCHRFKCSPTHWTRWRERLPNLNSFKISHYVAGARSHRARPPLHTRSIFTLQHKIFLW